MEKCDFKKSERICKIWDKFMKKTKTAIEARNNGLSQSPE